MIKINGPSYLFLRGGSSQAIFWTHILRSVFSRSLGRSLIQGLVLLTRLERKIHCLVLCCLDDLTISGGTDHCIHVPSIL